MGHVQRGSNEEKERELIRMTAAVLNVSPFGVNILGSLPYINKLGLAQKSIQYGNGKDKFVYQWPKRAEAEDDKAICECKVVRDGKDLTDWISGECSPKTIKMGPLQGYQNHMAQTRARNRAILEAYGVQIHEEMLTNIAKFLKAKDINSTQAQALATVAGKSVTTSSEEIESDKEKGSSPISNSLFQNDDVPTIQYPQDYSCARRGCGDEITKQQAEFTKRMHGRTLCKGHAKEAEDKK